MFIIQVQLLFIQVNVYTKGDRLPSGTFLLLLNLLCISRPRNTVFR